MDRISARLCSKEAIVDDPVLYVFTNATPRRGPKSGALDEGAPKDRVSLQMRGSGIECTPTDGSTELAVLSATTPALACAT
mmetsp:Transcript_9253/g.28011  ORF Transcript_9253/g.28011 Transcript_9253/m.28011 type:complete len:81 (+) Transcript_9253:2426-2668(+)